MASNISSFEFDLGSEGIDELSEWLEGQLAEREVERQNRLRVRLLTEGLLLNMREGLGAQTQARAELEGLFGKRYRLKVIVPGAPHNPLSSVDTEVGKWSSSLGTAIGIAPQYSHEFESNVLRVRVPSPTMNPVLKIAIAILVGLVLGVVGSLLPTTLDEEISDVLVEPTYAAWNRLLNAISAPIIFLTTLTTLLNAERIDKRGGNSLSVVARYFVLSILMVAIALLCAAPFFPLSHLRMNLNRDLVKNVLNLCIELIPADIVDPFAKSNTQQLLLMAFVLGFILIKLHNWAEGLRSLAREANLVGLTLAQWVSWLVPFVTAMFLCLELWNNRYKTLLALWIPLLVSVGLSLATLAVNALLVGRRQRVSPLLMLRKMRKPFFIALRTGSLDESLGETQNSCTRLLGIDRGFTKVALPQGLVLYMPVSAIGTIVFTLFVAQQFNVQTNTLWYIKAVLMAVIVFVATPPVPGANLLAYVVLFSALGIPSEALIDAMIFDIVFGIFAGAANQAMLQLELILTSDHFGLLDSGRLRAPMED